jgi:glycosyltransferase involved in cell wall biosynthesis
MYHDYLVYERRRWPERLAGRRPTRALADVRRRRARADALNSLQNAHLVRVLNPQEREWVLAARHNGDENVVLTPCGISDDRRAVLEEAGSLPNARIRRREVLFVGTWTLRKGCADVPAIVDSVARSVPEASFRLVGTYAEDEVRADLKRHEGRVRVTATYPAEAFPSMLAGATVLMAPSYAEGFGLAILEALAAGVPSVAYAAPGPQLMLSALPSRNLLVECGNAEGLASRVVSILTMAEPDYAALCRDCRQVSQPFRVDSLAETYELALQRVTRSAASGVP